MLHKLANRTGADPAVTGVCEAPAAGSGKLAFGAAIKLMPAKGLADGAAACAGVAAGGRRDFIILRFFNVSASARWNSPACIRSGSTLSQQHKCWSGQIPLNCSHTPALFRLPCCKQHTCSSSSSEDGGSSLLICRPPERFFAAGSSTSVGRLVIVLADCNCSSVAENLADR